MIVETIAELVIVGVFERGVANEERIVLQANETINMGQYGMMLGVKGADGTAFPIRDNLYWFGDGFVYKGDWIFLYTGPGEPKTSNLPNSNDKIYTLHWGRETTILRDENIVPILFKVDAVNIQSSVKSLQV